MAVLSSLQAKSRGRILKAQTNEYKLHHFANIFLTTHPYYKVSVFRVSPMSWLFQRKHPKRLSPVAETADRIHIKDP